MSSTYDFDKEDKYITFQIFGHEYRFWYPTTVQEEAARENKTDNIQFLISLVQKPDGADYEDFSEAYKRMNIKHVTAFTKMVYAELEDGADKSKEA